MNPELNIPTNTLDKFRLNGAVAVITGGAGLLGEKHAEAIIEGGGRAVLVDINQDKLDQKVSKLRAAYGDQSTYGYVLDITDEASVRETVAKIEAEVGPISILINNAANNPHVKADGTMDSARLETFSRETWDKDFAVGVTGAFLMSKYIAPSMAKRGKGVILNIASELGVVAPDQRLYRRDGLADDEQPVKPVSYSVVKHAVIGLTKYLSTYWLGGKVRSNAVAFGGVYTNQPGEFLVKIGKLSPMGRMARDDEYKGIVLFMCSDSSSYMTGSVVNIDGGRMAW